MAKGSSVPLEGHSAILGDHKAHTFVDVKCGPHAQHQTAASAAQTQPLASVAGSTRSSASASGAPRSPPPAPQPLASPQSRSAFEGRTFALSLKGLLCVFNQQRLLEESVQIQVPICLCDTGAMFETDNKYKVFRDSVVRDTIEIAEHTSN